MDERILKWLYDIKIAIDEINSFYKDDQRDFNLYKENLMWKRAVERELEIIGEAINRILKRDPSFEDQIQDAKRIVSLRNQVIHAYDNVSDEIIWAILSNHLPTLEKRVDQILDEK